MPLQIETSPRSFCRTLDLNNSRLCKTEANMDNPLSKPTQPRRLHPLVAVAAGAVIIASLAATAAVTGLFPKASSTSAQSDQSQAAQVTTQPGVVDSAAPVNVPANAATTAAAAQAQQAQQAAPPVPTPAQQQQYAQQQQAQAQQAPQYAQQSAPQPAYCSTCGTVVGISAVRQEGHGTGIGAVGGAVAGGVVGNQFGAGGGRTAMTLLGALGGGLAGNSVEKHIRSTTSYSVRVRMESGKTRYFTYHEAPPFQQGEHVRIENGSLVAG
jgi:outer membrane lipoprotein SlyB